MRELTTEEHKQFNEIFENLGASLDVPESRYDELVSSYQAVGNFLGDESSPLAPYKPEIQPQGSFPLGYPTMCKQREDTPSGAIFQCVGRAG